MAFVSAHKSRLLWGDFNLATRSSSFSSTAPVDILETTVLTDAAKTSIVGQNTSTAQISGYIDTDATADLLWDQLSDWKAAGTAEPVTFYPNLSTLGTECWMFGALMASTGFSAAVNGVAAFDLATQTDGATEAGVSLHDLTARTSDADGSSSDSGAGTTSGGAAHLHVTAYSGLTSIVVKVQHSTDNSSWSDLVTFSTVTALTSQRSTVSGTVSRYLRASWDVTGTGSCTFAVAFARR